MEPWCIVAIVKHDRVYTVRMPEAVADRATGLGWSVLIRDSEMPVGPHDIEPTQRNVKRSVTPEDFED